MLAYLALAGAIACSGSERPARTPKPAPEEESLAETALDPRFTTALERYASEVARLEKLLGAIDTSESDQRIRRALGLLGLAMERVPRPVVDDDVVSLAVTQIRAGEVEGTLIATPVEGGIVDPAERALNAASGALMHLARGTYAADPRVLEAALRLRDAVDAIGETSRLRPDRSLIVSALVQAAMVLRAMGRAAARGVLE